MSNIKILNDITVFNSITALSTVDVGNLIVRNKITSPEITFFRSASAHWESTYATVSSLSATWGSGGGGSGGSYVGALSVNWQNTYSTVSSLSTGWENNRTVVFSNSANWNDGYNKGIVFAGLSANYNNVFSTVNLLSTDWNNSVTVVNSKSGHWEDAYNYIVSISANETQQQTNSANWDSTYVTVSSLSTNWNNSFNSINALSASWNNNTSVLSSISSVYATVNSNSANWNSVFSTVNSTSANPVFNTFSAVASGNVGRLAIGTTIIPDASTELYVSGDVVISGNLSAAGSMTFTNTFFSTTSALSVINNGTGPTIVAVQYGDQPIAAFYDAENITNPALWVDGSNARPGYVGVGTKTPNVQLAVSGTLSALSANFNLLTVKDTLNTNILSANSIVVNGLLSASSYSPHNHTASQVTDFYSAALSATKNQMIIYSMLFG